jgi:LmbE family N-acetylglucosaminyl deacetylase
MRITSPSTSMRASRSLILNFKGRRAVGLLAALAVCGPAALAQRQLAGTPALEQSLERLRVVGSVLMIAAHPDDERTNVLAWSARGRHLRTAYLSLTRGDRGQNLIGKELFEQLGVIRTQELLAARRVDGAEQLFTRAFDFGFSKTADETMQKWGREEILGDIVWNIRRFRPDVLILGFSGTTRDGHGHHQTSAILGKEAFRAAADPKRFPEQLKYVQPWAAKRVFFPTTPFGRFNEIEDGPNTRINIDTGDFNTVLGFSYTEIAGQSRSNHRSQGFGAAETKGSAPAALIVTDGDPVKNDMMDGIDTTWRRIPGGAEIQDLADHARQIYKPESPELLLPTLAKMRQKAAALDHPDAKLKLKEIDETIALAAGLWVDAAADKFQAVPGEPVPVTLAAVCRVRNVQARVASVALEGMSGAPSMNEAQELAFNQRAEKKLSFTVPAGQPPTALIQLKRPRQGDKYDQPDLLDIGRPEGDPAISARFRVEIAGASIELVRPVIYRWVHPTHGELTRPLVVVPPVALTFARHSYLFADNAAQSISVEVRTNAARAGAEVSLTAPAGWTVSPAKQSVAFQNAGEVRDVAFTVTPPAGASRGPVRAAAQVGDTRVTTGLQVITYDHIPPQTLFPPAEAVLVHTPLRSAVKKIGYVMGPGDEVPEALAQMGCEVTMLDADDLLRGDLSRFEVIVLGVRVWNNRADLRTNWPRIQAYMEKGGSVVSQYNDSASFIFGRSPRDEAAQPVPGPYAFRVGRERVTVEDAPVKILAPDHPLLQFPNRITQADFGGWVQERGLYYANQWDDHYQPLLEMNDPGEPPQKGGLLFARYGQGTYVFAPLAFFRQLPAGVPGAYRLFANIISAGKAPRP